MRTALAFLSLLVAAPAVAADEHPFSDLPVEAKLPAFSPFVAASGGGVFVIDQERKVIMRFDVATSALSEAPIPDYVGFQYEFTPRQGALWVPDPGSQTVFKIDPATGQQVLAIKVPSIQSHGVAVVGDVVFVGVYADDKHQIIGYNATTGAEVRRIQTNGQPVFNLIAVGDVIWVNLLRHMVRLDPFWGKFSAPIPGEYYYPLRSDDGYLWVTTQDGTELHKIDPQSGEVLTRFVNTGDSLGQFAVGGGYLWMTTPRNDLAKLDPATGSVLAQYHEDNGNGLAFAGGSLWILSDGGYALVRVKAP